MTQALWRHVFIRYVATPAQRLCICDCDIEWSDGSKEWWVNGDRHRFDGPAVEWSNGMKEWWVNGKHVKTNRG